MPRPRQQLDKGRQGKEALRTLKAEPAGWRRERLLAIKLGLEGELKLEEIAQTMGHGRATIQRWFDAYRRGGIKELLQDRRYGRQAGPPSALSAKAAAGIAAGLEKGTWRTAAQVQSYLREEHGVQVALTTVYKYLGKCEARLKVPRPSHTRKDEEKVRTFREELAAKLTELQIEKGRSVRLWVIDEMRYGLQPVTRRVWSLRGKRVVVPVNPAYQWGYVFGALQVGGGGAEFFYSPTVNLDCSRLFLEQISRRDPQAIHVIIWDGAGFHQKESDASVPENIRLIELPAYSPELNPIEKLWDIVKDGICNRIFSNLHELEVKITELLSGYWKNARKVFDLIGAENWLMVQANAI